MMTAVETNLASKGAPVIFGEWGVPDEEKENDYTNKNADMLAFAQYFVEQAKAKGFGTFYWMGLSDGASRSVNQEDLKDAIVQSSKTAGQLQLTATSDGLKENILTITAQ